MSKKGYKIPPTEIPAKLLNEFTMDGSAVVLEKYLDNADPAVQEAFNENFTSEQLHDYQAKCSRGETHYYGATDAFLWNAFINYPIAGKHVLLMGSANQWYEAILLNWGAKKITVCEYSDRPDIHPLITYIKPDQLEEDAYEVCVSISSFEHDGLGRYGDPINPNGDIEAMQSVRKALKDDGIFFLAVPIGADKLVWNAHRIYGFKRLEKLLDTWAVNVIVGVEKDEDFERDTGDDATFQPVIVLSKYDGELNGMVAAKEPSSL